MDSKPKKKPPHPYHHLIGGIICQAFDSKKLPLAFYQNVKAKVRQEGKRPLSRTESVEWSTRELLEHYSEYVRVDPTNKEIFYSRQLIDELNENGKLFLDLLNRQPSAPLPYMSRWNDGKRQLIVQSFTNLKLTLRKSRSRPAKLLTWQQVRGDAEIYEVLMARKIRAYALAQQYLNGTWAPMYLTDSEYGQILFLVAVEVMDLTPRLSVPDLFSSERCTAA